MAALDGRSRRVITSAVPMLIYVISDRRLRPDLDPLEMMTRMACCGADMMQVREKDLPAGALLSLCRRAAGAARAEVYVNQRVDVALSAAARGVHLPADGLPVRAVRRAWGGVLRIGVSTHSRAEAVAAQDAGADYITCGPVFDTPSKRAYGPPLGVDALREAVEAVSIPVFAIGGIHAGNVAQVARVKVAGVAMIAAVIGSDDMAAAVDRVRKEAA